MPLVVGLVVVAGADIVSGWRRLLLRLLKIEPEGTVQEAVLLILPRGTGSELTALESASEAAASSPFDVGE